MYTPEVTWEWWGVIALYVFIALYGLWTCWQFRKDFKQD